MFVSDGSPPRSVAARLRRVHGLTPAEARLAAALLEGVTLDDYAERAGVTWNTVRTHFANARNKVGARNHADLVRKLLAALPPVEPTGD